MNKAFINDWQPTGLLYVDMVAACVSHHRRHYLAVEKPLKTIYLGGKAFTQFTDWVRFELEKEGRKEEAENANFEYTFDGVEIRLNSALMGEKMYFDYYENNKKAEA